MKQNIRSFPQHSMETCGISCMLMVLDLHDKVGNPTTKKEQSFYRTYRSKAYCGTLGASIVQCMGANDLTVRLFHSSENYLENNGGYLPAAMHRLILEEYRDILSRCRDSAEINTGCSITCDTLKSLLDAGNTVFIHTLVPGDSLLNQLRFDYRLARCHFPESDIPQDLYADELEEALTLQEESPLEQQLVFPGFLKIPVILRGTAKELLKLLRCEKITHWILAYGYEGDTFFLCDPMGDPVKFTLTAEELETYLDTPFGRTCIAVSES